MDLILKRISEGNVCQEFPDRTRARGRTETVFLFGNFLGNRDGILANNTKTSSEVLGSVVVQAILLSRTPGDARRERILACWFVLLRADKVRRVPVFACDLRISSPVNSLSRYIEVWSWIPFFRHCRRSSGWASFVHGSARSLKT